MRGTNNMKKYSNLWILILLFSFFVIGSFAYLLQNSNRENNTTEEVVEETEVDPALWQGPKALIRLEEEPLMVPADFVEAKKHNEDVYAWIDILDTNVHYPILQGGPYEDYYLDHTIDKEAGYPGSIYTQMINAKDFTDYNTVIYGHNMKNGTMFKHLHKFEEKEFFDKHEYITIYTETEMFMYRVYASVVYSDKHILKKYNFEQPEDRMAFIQSLDTGESLNHFRKGMTVDEESKLLTLATCIGGRPNNRWLVVGELVNRP